MNPEHRAAHQIDGGDDLAGSTPTVTEGSDTADLGLGGAA